MRDNMSLIGNDGPLIADAFDACAEAIMSMPLADRLTDEEKEKIKEIFKRANDSYEANFRIWLKTFKFLMCSNEIP